MKLNIILKFILVVGIPLIAVYMFVGYMQYRSMVGMVEREGSLRAKVSVELLANTLDERLSLIGSATRSLAGYASLNPKGTRGLQDELLRDLINTDPLLNLAAIAWGDPSQTGMSGLSLERKDGTLDSSPLTEETIHRLVDDYSSVEQSIGNWLAPIRSSDGLAHDAAIVQPITIDGQTAGLVVASLSLTQLQDDAIRSSLSSSRFAIVNNSWIVLASTKTKHMGNPLVGIINPDETAAAPEDTTAFNEFLSQITSDRKQGKKSNSQPVPVRYDGDEYWVAWSVMNEPKWLMIDAIPEATLLEPVYSLLQRDTLYRIGGVFLILLCLLGSALLLTRRIRRLHAAMELVRNGDLDIRVNPGHGRDEITRLGEGFNLMVDSLSRNLDELARSEADRIAVDRELDIARNIQQSLQPELPPEFPHPVDFEIAAINLAARHVGGDFYDYWIMDDKHMAFMLGDVSGKGVPAAIFMGVSRTTIRMVAGRERSPDRILKRVNESLLKDNNQGLFITLFLGVYNIETGVLRYANAGHHSAILKSVDDPSTLVAGATGTILGTLPEAEWTEETLQINPGDHFILYTDGLSEAHGDDGVMLDATGIEQFLDKRKDSDAQTVCRELIGMAESIQSDQLFDDVTVMDLHRRSPEKRP
ncbi:MAG: hypothetical protein CMJ40_03175 [Phycisphaerae bacterium]|nr:hypothetical protein [Phycisphaerae bacterium]